MPVGCHEERVSERVVARAVHGGYRCVRDPFVGAPAGAEEAEAVVVEGVDVGGDEADGGLDVVEVLGFADPVVGFHSEVVSPLSTMGNLFVFFGWHR